MKAVCFRPGILHGARGAGKGVPGRGAATICAAAFTGALTRSRCPGGGRSPVSGGGVRHYPPYPWASPGVGRAGFPLPGVFTTNESHRRRQWLTM